ncbi:duf724 domain-containing protein 3 [Quercus suber]|uniref:Duf724 domain-containing protein 3 n=1 Tax=Quercus suber TaxID=58331 RepID=A0AAW0M213_QUESU
MATTGSRRGPPTTTNGACQSDLEEGNQVGFVGSYYVATVITNKGNHSYVVHYRNLPLTEIVAADELRPMPPKVSATRFSLYDAIDAYDNDGWWVGTISEKQGSNYYYVFFNTYG